MAAGHEELRNLDRPSEGGKAYGLGCPSLRVPYPEGEPKQQMDQEMLRRVPNRRDRAKGRRAQGEERDGSEQQEPRKSCRSPNREESHADFPGNSIALRTRSEPLCSLFRLANRRRQPRSRICARARNLDDDK